MDLALASCDSLSVFLLICDCLLQGKCEVTHAVQYLPEQPRDVWTGRLPNDLRVWQRQDRLWAGLALAPRGFLTFSKAGASYKHPMGAQKPCDEPRVRRARGTTCGQGPAEVLHLAQCPASDHPSPCRSREVLAARDCLEMELEHVCFDEPSATGPGWQTPPGGETAPQPQANNEDGRCKSWEK